MKRWAVSMIAGAMLLGTAVSSFADEREGRIARREERQQKRIGQGVANGSLTAGEAAHLERQESRLNREVRNDRKANGGQLTPAERAQINRQQNRLSKEIYTDKHNAANQK
jgi:hypothetical protein